MRDAMQNIILAVKKFHGVDSFRQAADRIKTEARLSPQKDGRVFVFMPCSHSLASDVRGFFVSGMTAGNASVSEMLCPYLGKLHKGQRGQNLERVARWHGNH